MLNVAMLAAKWTSLPFKNSKPTCGNTEEAAAYLAWRQG